MVKSFVYLSINRRPTAFPEMSRNFYDLYECILYSPLQIWPYMSTLWTRKIGGKNSHVYVYVYGYKVRLHVYKNCVNVAALVAG